MKRYEYVRLYVDFEDLRQLNRFAAEGWHVIWIKEPRGYALLERRLPKPV